MSGTWSMPGGRSDKFCPLPKDEMKAEGKLKKVEDGRYTECNQ